jgi:hypothetical protein
LSSQGLELWQDERRRRRWLGVELQAERGFWALGEAIMDAVVSRDREVRLLRASVRCF